MNKLIIKKNKIDWLKIINLAFKRRDWGKTYTLYHYGNVTINCTMRDFNFERSVATFRVRINYVYDGISYTDSDLDNYDCVEYFVNNFSIEDFKSLVNKRIKSLIKKIRELTIKKEAHSKYFDLYHYAWKLDTEKEAKTFGLSEDYKKILSITDEEIKTACLDKFKDQLRDFCNKEYDEKVEAYIRNTVIDLPYFDKIMEDLK